jgi:hypothetical protein
MMLIAVELMVEDLVARSMDVKKALGVKLVYVVRMVEAKNV